MNPRDKQLLDLAASNATPNEMEAATGIPAAQAVSRVKSLLQSRDIWSELERRQSLLHDLDNLKNEIVDESDNDVVTLQAIRLLSETLDKQYAVTRAEMEKVSEVQARKMVDMIGRAFTKMEEAHPEISTDSLRGAFARGLEAAYAEINS